jgi:hypothetical protein
MAKVRLQARYSDDEDGSIAAAIDSDKEANPAAAADLESGTAPRKRTQRYSGSVDVLRKAYNEKGLVGWYQVRGLSSLFFEICGGLSTSIAADRNPLVIFVTRVCKLRS